MEIVILEIDIIKELDNVSNSLEKSTRVDGGHAGLRGIRD